MFKSSHGTSPQLSFRTSNYTSKGLGPRILSQLKHGRTLRVFVAYMHSLKAVAVLKITHGSHIVVPSARIRP